MRLKMIQAREIRWAIMDAREGYWDEINFGPFWMHRGGRSSLYRNAWIRTDKKQPRKPPKGRAGGSK